MAAIARWHTAVRPFSSPFPRVLTRPCPVCFIASRRGRGRFHVSGRWRSERSIRQLQQTRPSRGLQKVLHMSGGYRQGIWLPHWYGVQDRRRRRQRSLRGPWGRSRMVSLICSPWTLWHYRVELAARIFHRIREIQIWKYLFYLNGNEMLLFYHQSLAFGIKWRARSEYFSPYSRDSDLEIKYYSFIINP